MNMQKVRFTIVTIVMYDEKVCKDALYSAELKDADVIVLAPTPS
jgi:hypothetical protein